MIVVALARANVNPENPAPAIFATAERQGESFADAPAILMYEGIPYIQIMDAYGLAVEGHPEIVAVYYPAPSVGTVTSINVVDFS